MTKPATWVVTNDPPPTRRNAATQNAYDYFWKEMEVGQSVLIPKAEGSTAKNAAAQLRKESDDSVQIRFRDEGEVVRATKVKGPSKAEVEAALAAPAETAEPGADTPEA